MIFMILKLYLVDEHLDNIDDDRIPREYLRNMKDPLEKYNDDQFFKTL